MYKQLRQYRAKQAREHKEWYEKNVKDKSKICFYPFGTTDWAEVAEAMTAAERKFYKVHIEKSRRIKRLISDILAGK